MAEKKKEQKPPPPKPRPKPQPPIQPQPNDVLRDRRRLGLNYASQQETTPMKPKFQNTNRPKGLGMAKSDWGTKMRPANQDSGPDPRMPYKPGTGEARTLPYKPGTGSTQTMPYRPKPRMEQMSYDNPPMDGGWPSSTPPAWATMPYDPATDGTAGDNIGTWDPNEDAGYENMGKQEYNQSPRYDNQRSEEGAPVEEDRAWMFNDLYDEFSRNRPDVGENANPTEVAQWERAVRARGKEYGLSDEEIDKVIDDLYAGS
jgi:hypothetical protein